MFRIKICGITNVDDALAAVESGADAIGLNFFNKSRRFVEPRAAREIARSLMTEVLRVGVFVNHTSQEICEIVDHVALHAVQLHGDETPELVAALPREIQVIRAHRCGADGLSSCREFLEASRAVGRMPDAVLIDADARTEYGGTGELADWPRIVSERPALRSLPLILAGGLKPENVAAAIATVKPSGVDVASGVESQPGKKDHTLVAKFANAAREAFDMLRA